MAALNTETPPHAWGRLPFATGGFEHFRNTPTCVGKTLTSFCGLALMPETPPRAWGRRHRSSEVGTEL